MAETSSKPASVFLPSPTRTTQRLSTLRRRVHSSGIKPPPVSIQPIFQLLLSQLAPMTLSQPVNRPLFQSPSPYLKEPQSRLLAIFSPLLPYKPRRHILFLRPHPTSFPWVPSSPFKSPQRSWLSGSPAYVQTIMSSTAPPWIKSCWNVRESPPSFEDSRWQTDS